MCFLFFPYRNGNILSVKEAELHQQQKERHNIQKEVWSNLFSYREYVEKPPKRFVRDLNLNKNSRNMDFHSHKKEKGIWNIKRYSHVDVLFKENK
jgi:hypothetical protein